MSKEWSVSTVWPSNWYGRCRNVAVALMTVYAVKKLFDKMRPSKERKFHVSNFTQQPGLVVLHQFSRGKFSPNLSPFALKVECFLRLADIPYTVDCTVPFGPKGKCPWVNMEDGSPLGDSQFIINSITLQEKACGADARLPPGDKGLSSRDRGALEGVRLLVEEQLFWCVIYWRYYLDSCRVFLTTQRFPRFLQYTFPIFMRRGIKKKTDLQGIGLHSPDEVYDIARKTCQALDDYLGDSEFFCGSNPGTADCAVFGGLAQIMWNAPATRYEALVAGLFPRLAAYCIRMKERVFPDWDQMLQEGWKG